MKAHESAFPTPESEFNQNGMGLTKREYAAIKIMAGLATDDLFYENGGRIDSIKAMANKAVEFADALI